MRKITPRLKVWLEIDSDYCFGHGISEILKAVDACGSIKEAARSVGKSYRYVWRRIKDAEQALGASLVETQVGGKDTQRSRLTEVARSLVTDFDAMRSEMHARLESEFSGRFQAALVRSRRRG